MKLLCIGFVGLGHLDKSAVAELNFPGRASQAGEGSKE